MSAIHYKPYFGVTGFTQRWQIEDALDGLPEDGTHLFMVGILVSFKSLRGLPMREQWQTKYPSRDYLPSLFLPDPRLLNLIHYSVGGGFTEDFNHDLFVARHLVGEGCNGWQLNIKWPDVTTIERYRLVYPDDVIVLQLNSRALADVSHEPERVCARLASDYDGLVTHVLIDLSGGVGKPMDITYTRRLLRQIDQTNWLHGGFNLVVAGGLGPGALAPIEALLPEFPNLSWDAETGVRDDRNRLDQAKVLAYRDQSLELAAYLD